MIISDNINLSKYFLDVKGKYFHTNEVFKSEKSCCFDILQFDVTLHQEFLLHNCRLHYHNFIRYHRSWTIHNEMLVNNGEHFLIQQKFKMEYDITALLCAIQYRLSSHHQEMTRIQILDMKVQIYSNALSHSATVFSNFKK